MRVGIWERDEGIRAAVEAGLGELAAEVRAGRHPAELAGARLELLTVSPAARGWAGAGAVPCGTVLLPGTAGPLARALNARQAVSYGTSPRDTLTFSSLEGDRLCLAVQRELVTLGGEVGRPLVGHKLEECLQAMTVNLEQVPEPAGGSGEVFIVGALSEHLQGSRGQVLLQRLVFHFIVFCGFHGLPPGNAACVRLFYFTSSALRRRAASTAASML